MKLKNFFPFILLTLISVIFFYKTFFFFQIPFPGDILIADYAPWKFEKYMGYNPGSYPNKAQYFDVIRQLYPWRILAMDQIKSGQLPLWNPYNFSGSPLFANNQSAVFYPLNLLFLVFNNVVAWSMYILAGPILACVFTYLFARKIKLSEFGSILSSICYGFSLYMSVFFEYGNFSHTILWAPFILYFIERWFDKKSAVNLAFISGGIAFAGFAGHLQLFSGVVGFAIYYLILRSILEKKKDFLFPIISIVIGFGICAVQLLPTFELIQNAARSSLSYQHYVKDILFQFHQFILFVAPDSYGNPATRNYILTDTYPGNAIYFGVLGILFSAYSLKYYKNLYVKLFGISSILIIIFITNNPLTQLLFQLDVPFIASSSPSNYMFLLTFSLAMLAGIGIGEFEKKFDKTILKTSAGVVLVFLILFVFHKIFHVEIVSKQLLFGGLILIASFATIFIGVVTRRKAILYVILLVLVVDLFVYFQKFNPFVPPSLAYPETSIVNYLQDNAGYNRFIGNKAATIESNFATGFHIYSPDGYDPLYPKSYNAFTQSTSRSDVVLSLSTTQQLNELGVKYILDRIENGSDQKTFPPGKFKPIYTQNEWVVYQNLDALPRAFVRTQKGIVSAAISSYSPNKVTIRTENAKGRLVLTDTYYPGWSAEVDGKPTKIIKDSGIFRSLEINNGSHTIVFSYQPFSFYLGLIISIISIGSLTLLVLLFRIQKKA